jgi:shikimate dehydrogenase
MTSPALQEIIALLGCPAAGNPAQYLFERAIEAAGIDWRFVTFDVEPARIGDAIAGVAALGFRGCLLARPLQESAAALVATTTPSATFSGGVSLIDRQPDGLVGHMTDGRGVVEALRSHVDPASTQVLILGGGPAARATALELALARCPGIVVCDPQAERAEAAVAAINGLEEAAATALPWESTIEIPAAVGIIVSVLPADGLEPGIRLVGLRSDMVVADLPLVPQPSRVLAVAMAAGACAIDGLEIHTEKTAIDFHTWTGIKPDSDMLREALDEFLDA